MATAARSETPGAVSGVAATGPRRGPAGWWVVAAKELADHVTSIRFVVLLVILALAVAVPVYFSSGLLRDAADRVSGAAAVFLALFTIGPQDIPLLRFDAFVAFLAPLLGIAFGFDAVNVERSEGTLPRLLSQPIHRDDVINGKFAAGLAVIALTLAALTTLVAGFGIFRLGVVPTPVEVVRLLVWLLITIVYVGLWLAFATLISVVVRRAATSALIAFGAWLGITLFGNLVATLLGNVVAPAAASTTLDEALRSAQVQQLLSRLMPDTLYREASVVLLNPGVTQVSVPLTIGQIEQAQQQIPTLLSLDQSLLLVWPQVVALVALMVVCFAAAYALFMRQEVRA